MKFRFILALWAVLLSMVSSAQVSSNKAYAITSQTNGSFDWTEVKLIDLGNSQVVKNVFQNSGGNYNLYNGRSSKQIIIENNVDSADDKGLRPFSGYSAACAYDRRSNRLYYAPIYINELRYIDLNSSDRNVYLFEGEKFSSAIDMDLEKNHVTRMVISSDGNGYAMNNDGSHLVRFTTGDRPIITDLGAVTDAPGNGDFSISDANTSWGGDLLADASGNLYAITAHNHVFKINVDTRIATYLTKIKDLPVSFTTNGAAVDANGQIILSSANFLTAYYRVDPLTWEAQIVESNMPVYNTSDLANENLLFKTTTKEVEAPVIAENISLFPNPVKGNIFTVSFANKEPAFFNIRLLDIRGRVVSDKSVAATNKGQVSEIRVSPSLARGLYMVQILDKENQTVFHKKIVLE